MLGHLVGWRDLGSSHPPMLPHKPLCLVIAPRRPLELLACVSVDSHPSWVLAFQNTGQNLVRGHEHGMLVLSGGHTCVSGVFCAGLCECTFPHLIVKLLHVLCGEHF